MRSTGAVIRAARPADAEAIAEIHVETWRAYAGQMPDEVLDRLSVDDRARMWHNLLCELDSPRRVHVADSEGGLLGFVVHGPSREHDTEALVGEVYALYVHPHCWSAGIGRALLSAAVSHFADVGMSEALLWVLASNHRACRFYELAGWTHDGRLKSEPRAGLPDLDAQLEEACYRRPVPADVVKANAAGGLRRSPSTNGSPG